MHTGRERKEFLWLERPQLFWHFANRVVHGYFVPICLGFWRVFVDFDVGRDGCGHERICAVMNLDGQNE